MNDPIKPVHPSQKTFEFAPGAYDKSVNPRAKKKTKKRSRRARDDPDARHVIDEYV